MKSPIKVAVTGAAGQIGYSLLFRIASGSMVTPASGYLPDGEICCSTRHGIHARRRLSGKTLLSASVEGNDLLCKGDTAARMSGHPLYGGVLRRVGATGNQATSTVFISQALFSCAPPKKNPKAQELI